MATTQNILRANYHRTLKLGLVFSIIGLAYTNFLLIGIPLLAIGIGALCYERWTKR